MLVEPFKDAKILRVLYVDVDHRVVYRIVGKPPEAIGGKEFVLQVRVFSLKAVNLRLFPSQQRVAV